jgi:hypothetical protein
MAPDNTPIFVNEDVAGRVLGGDENPIPPRTLQRWRVQGDGPPFYKFKQAVRYRQLLAWAAERRRTRTAA